MISNPHTPAKVIDRVVDTLLARVALRFHGVTTQGACCRGTITSAHENRISSMTKVVGTCVSGTWFMWIGGWRSGQAEAFGGEVFSRSFKSDGGDTKGQTEEAGDCTTQRVADKPDIGVGVDLCDVGVEIDCSSIVSVFIAQSLDEACLVAGVC